MKTRSNIYNRLTGFVGFPLIRRFHINPPLLEDKHGPTVKSSNKGHVPQRGVQGFSMANVYIAIMNRIHSWVWEETENRDLPYTMLKRAGTPNLRYVFKKYKTEIDAAGKPRKELQFESPTNLRLLPNMRKMTITKLIVVKALEFFKISWVDTRRIELWGWRNKKANKYLKAQYSRLWHLRGKRDKLGQILPSHEHLDTTPASYLLRNIGRESKANDKYWNLAHHLMTHSEIFQTVHINFTLRKWERDSSFGKVCLIIKEMQRLLATGDWHNLRLTRVWIESNGLRPLGVPAKAHLIIGSMLSSLLEFYVTGSFRCNHGYHAYHGTGTAWKKILSQDVNNPGIINYHNIWETDIQGFFNNVCHRTLYDILKALGLPSWLYLRLIKMQQTAPILPSETPLTEAEDEPPWDEGEKVWAKKSHTGPNPIKLKKDTIPGAKKTMYYKGDYNVKGVAQGHSLSPLLAILVLEYALRSYERLTKLRNNPVSVLAYADDLMLFSNHPIDVDLFKQVLRNITGCVTDPAKTKWNKQNNIWKSPIKFLGLIFDPFVRTGILKACTRKGASLILDTSITNIYQGDKLIETKEGWIWMEPYKLGVPIRLPFWQSVITKTKRKAQEVQVPNPLWPLYYVLLTAILIPWDPVFMFFINVLSVTLYYLLAQPYIIWIIIEETKMKLKYTTETHIITWRSVVKEGYLNKFMAKLYNNKLQDTNNPQDFSLKYTNKSLLGILLSQREPLDEIPWMNLKRRQKINRILWHETGTTQLLKNDINAKITVFNSSTIGTYFLIKVIPLLRGDDYKPLNPQQLLERFKQTLNINGIWHNCTAQPNGTTYIYHNYPSSLLNMEKYIKQINNIREVLQLNMNNALEMKKRTSPQDYAPDNLQLPPMDPKGMTEPIMNQHIFCFTLFWPQMYKLLRQEKKELWEVDYIRYLIASAPIALKLAKLSNRKLKKNLIFKPIDNLWNVADWYELLDSSRFQNFNGESFRYIHNFWNDKPEIYTRIRTTYRGLIDMTFGEETQPHLQPALKINGFTAVRPRKRKQPHTGAHPMSTTEMKLFALPPFAEADWRNFGENFNTWSPKEVRHARRNYLKFFTGNPRIRLPIRTTFETKPRANSFYNKWINHLFKIKQVPLWQLTPF